MTFQFRPVYLVVTRLNFYMPQDKGVKNENRLSLKRH